LTIKIKKDISLLNLGCGRNWDSIFFAQQGFQVTALDISKNRINALKQERARLGTRNNRQAAGQISKSKYLRNRSSL